MLALCSDGDIGPAGARLGRELERLGLGADDVARFSELVEGVWWSTEADAAGLQLTLDTVERALVRAVPAGLAPVALHYIRAVCEEAWELSWEHAPLFAVMERAESVARNHLQVLDEVEAARVEAAVESLRVLGAELSLESAVGTGSLADVARVGAAGAKQAGTVWRLAQELPGDSLAETLTGVAMEKGSQLQAIATAASAVEQALAGDPTALTPAIAHFRSAEEDDWVSQTSADELRSHRRAMEAIRDAADEDWLRVDDGTITHVFPFGLRVSDHSAVVDVVKRDGAKWSLGGVPLGNAPTSLLLIDDIWRGEDPLERRYEGTQLDLPEVVATIGGSEARLAVSIVISQLGNHHLRVALDISDAMPDVLAEACLLPLPEAGNLEELGRPLRFDDHPGGPTWGRLCELVGSVLADLRQRLDEGGLPTQLSFRPGMYHVVSEVRRASALTGGDPGRARELDDASELPELFGSRLLCTALPSGVGSVADWTIPGAPAGTVVGTSIAVGTLLQVSTNQTLIASMAAPSFMLGSLRQAVEFVVSLEGMFAAWQDELSQFQTDFAPYLTKFANAGETDIDADEVDADVAALEQMHVRLRRFVTSARISLLFIDSPALVSSPVVRQTLSDLLGLSPVWARRHDFTQTAGEALSGRFEELIQGWGKRRAERREARNRTLIETMLAVIAGIGISGIASIVQAGFDLKGWFAFMLVAAVLALALLAGVAAFLWLRDPYRKPRGK